MVVAVVVVRVVVAAVVVSPQQTCELGSAGWTRMDQFSPVRRPKDKNERVRFLSNPPLHWVLCPPVARPAPGLVENYNLIQIHKPQR